MQISGEKIKSIRVSKGLSRAELSRRSGISIRTLEDWESGRRNPRNVDIIYQLCNALEIEIEDIISSEGMDELRAQARANSDLSQDESEEEIRLVRWIEDIFNSQGVTGILRLMDRFIYETGVDRALEIMEEYADESSQD